MKKEYKNPELIIEEVEVEDPILQSQGPSEQDTFGGFFGI